MNKTWQVVLAFIGIFGAGVVAGLFVAPQIWKEIVDHKASEQFTMQRMKRLSEQLKLTPEQVEKLTPVITQAGDDYRRLAKENSDVGERLEENIKKQLSEAQWTEYVDLRNKRHEREKLWQRWVKEQRAKQEAEGRVPFDLPPPPPAATSTSTPSPAPTK